MSGQSDEYERSLAFSEIALAQIKALRQPAYPRNYEVWYAYATGYNPTLNQTINETITRNGTLTPADVDQIYETYLSPARLSDRIENVGGQIVDEIEQVMAMIDAAVGSASQYTESLAHATQDLGTAKDRDGLRAIVETLVRTTRDMEKNNTRLESSLRASKQEINQLQVNLEAVRNESLTDPLTSLANRKYFDSSLDKFIAQSAASGEPMALLLADIDHFKAFNDTFGHLTGDQVLRLVAIAFKQNVKGQDIAARYGGEEFAIILPGTTLRSALTVADQVRRAVMTKELMKRSTGEHLGRVTVSIGAAGLRRGETAQSLIERADSCLYAAKRCGRNRVICETDPEVASVAPSKVA
ncbi:MAG: GGDEF domain-containing protein [Alphaproteobacteria bacterium]|nr:MAG: GGDEF domain-containing protein [Alphaproteobacteria bacterium]